MTTPLPITPVLPSCPAVLQIQSRSVTSQYKRALTDSCLIPRYHTYLREKNQWTQQVIADIAWKSLSIAIHRISRDVLVTKCCNNILPTATVLKRWNYQRQDTCCLCQSLEDSEHLFRCSHPTRISWRRQSITSLRQRMSTLGFQPIVIDTLATCLTEWLDTGTVSPEKYPKSLHPVIHFQSEIGWHHMFAGHISLQWFTDLDLHSGSYSPLVLGGYLAEFFLTSYISLWEQRNKDLHGHTLSQRQLNYRRRVVQKVRTLFKLKSQTCPSHAHLFPDDMETFLLKTPTSMLSYYHRAYEKPILASVTKAINASVTNTRPITQYFQLLDHSKQPPESITQDGLVFDAYSKKRRHKAPASPTNSLVSTAPNRTIQTTMNQYFT